MTISCDAAHETVPAAENYPPLSDTIGEIHDISTGRPWHERQQGEFEHMLALQQGDPDLYESRLKMMLATLPKERIELLREQAEELYGPDTEAWKSYLYPQALMYFLAHIAVDETTATS